MNLEEVILNYLYYHTYHTSTIYPLSGLYDNLFLIYPTKLSYTNFIKVIKQLEKKNLLQLHKNASFRINVSLTKKGKMFVL